MAMLKFSPTYTSDTDDHGVGNVYWGPDGKAYKWVEVVDLDGVAANTLLPANTSGTQVTLDVSGGSAIGTKVVGICVTAVDISVAKYAFMQVSGVADVYSDGSVAAGESVTQHASTNGMMDTMADGLEELVFGVALEADSGTPVTAAVYLQGLI